LRRGGSPLTICGSCDPDFAGRRNEVGGLTGDHVLSASRASVEIDSVEGLRRCRGSGSQACLVLDRNRRMKASAMIPSQPSGVRTEPIYWQERSRLGQCSGMTPESLTTGER
jgi:hypothetical protein